MQIQQNFEIEEEQLILQHKKELRLACRELERKIKDLVLEYEEKFDNKYSINIEPRKIYHPYFRATPVMRIQTAQELSDPLFFYKYFIKKVKSNFFASKLSEL